RGRREEGGDGVAVELEQVGGERQEQDRAQHRRQVPFAPPGEGQHRRPHQVELLLDREAPQVQQRLQLGIDVEVARLVPQQDVGNVDRGGGDLLSEQLVFERRQQEPAGDQAQHQDQQQRREQPVDASDVELDVGELAAPQVEQQQRGDQVGRDDEEDVD